eukprot:gene18145-20665_t
MLKDDWTQFTLANLTRVKSARSREGVATAEAKQRHVERAIQRYLNIGNLRKGMQRATDTTEAAPGTPETLAKLQAKHPTLAEAQQTDTRQVNSAVTPIELSTDVVAWSIRMAAKGAKHGLDKLRVEHLRQLLLGDATNGLLKSFTELCTRIVNNKLDQRILPYIKDAEIVAARKGENDVRPIVICGAIRKIALSSARRVVGFTKSKIFKSQYGLTKCGTEKITMSMRTALDINDTLNLVVLDATNAFNNASRNKAIDLVEEHFPSMMPIVQALYGSHATIWYSGMITALAKVIAEVGFQQGCVLGSWLYCLSLQELINIIIEELAEDGLPFFYIDDGNLVATFEATLRVFHILKERGPEFGYHIKWPAAKYLMGKCATQEEANARKLQLIEVGFKADNVLIHPDNLNNPTEIDMKSYGVTVLGAFIGSDEYIKQQLSAKLEETRVECEALIAISDLQSRFMLLNWCFKTKIHYWLRTTKLSLTEEFIEGFEAQKRLFLQSIMDHENGTGITTLNDLTWRIAQLSSQNGGLGMENLRHVRYAATIAAIISAGGGIYNEKSMENPLTPDEPCSIVRDFHQAHAIILQVDASLTWSKLKEMSKRTASTLQHTITALLQKKDLDALLAREPGPNALPYAHYNWFSSLQQKEA